jgi:hypothetical protein
MPGANCSIYGCGTSRKHAGISIFRNPAKDDDLSTKTREAWVRLVTRDREIDSSLQKQIDQRTIHICERHFEKNLIETCKFGSSYSYIIIACELKGSVLIFIYGSWAYVMEI